MTSVLFVAKDGLEFLVLLSPPPKCWDFTVAPCGLCSQGLLTCVLQPWPQAWLVTWYHLLSRQPWLPTLVLCFLAARLHPLLICIYPNLISTELMASNRNRCILLRRRVCASLPAPGKPFFKAKPVSFLIFVLHNLETEVNQE